jgi:predicted transcriptional regulator of viral defense system
MIDVRVAELAARQHNRFSLAQVEALGMSREAVRHRLAAGRWMAVHEAVFAIPPVLEGERGRMMAATLTAPGSVLSHASAGAAWGWWTGHRVSEIVTRPGDGGPCLADGVLVHRSERLAGEVTTVHGIPVTTVPRTLLDLTPHIGNGLLARSVREAIRTKTTTAAEIVDALAGRHRGRRGCRRLALTVARYTGLPVDRARSGAEVIALELLRDAGRPMPQLNRRIAGEEADLSWAGHRLIIEIDGGPFHLDAGEDARKTAIWQAAGWTVKRVPSDAVVQAPWELLTLAPNVEEGGS